MDFLRLPVVFSPFQSKNNPFPAGGSQESPKNTSLSLWERSGEGFHIASPSYAGGVPSPNLPQGGRDLHIRRTESQQGNVQTEKKQRPCPMYGVVAARYCKRFGERE